MTVFERLKLKQNRALIWLLHRLENGIFAFTTVLIRASSKLQLFRLALETKGQS